MAVCQTFQTVLDLSDYFDRVGETNYFDHGGETNYFDRGESNYADRIESIKRILIVVYIFCSW